MRSFLHKRNSKFLYMFLLSHLTAYLALLIIPANAIVENKTNIVLLNLIFVFLVTLFFIITTKLFKTKNYKMNNTKIMTKKQLRFNIRFVSLGSIIGFFLMLYDRVFIRGIDYSLGLRHARYQWLDSAGGSLYSVIGNLLIPFGYISLFFLIFHSSNLRKKDKFILVISSILSVFGHAALNGGRSNVLIALVFWIIIVIVKKNFIGERFNINAQTVKKIIIFFLIVSYTFFITMSSAEMGNVSIQNLTELGIDSLYGTVNKRFYEMNSHNSLLFLIIYSLAYLYHGQWTAEVSFSLATRTGNYTFFSFIVMLRSLGLEIGNIEQGYFAKTGAFISLPGAFYYDFGYIGVIILSIILGILFAIAILFLNNSKVLTSGKLGFIIYILFIVFLSPMLPAYGFMYLNFICFSFIWLDLLNRFIFRERVSFIIRGKTEMENSRWM